MEDLSSYFRREALEARFEPWRAAEDLPDIRVPWIAMLIYLALSVGVLIVVAKTL